MSKKNDNETAIQPAAAAAEIQARQQASVPVIPMGPAGIQLGTFEDAQRFAKAVIASGFAPKGMNEAGVIVSIQMGAELGLAPMQSMQNIAVINGRPAVWGDAIPAVCMASGAFDHGAWHEEIETDAKGNPIAATCRCRRLGGSIIDRRFSLGDAQRAGLVGKPGPWAQYPARMLQMRARSWALRDAFPDVLRGFHVADRDSGVMVDGPPTEGRQVRQIADPLSTLTERLAPPPAEPVYAPPREPGEDPELFEEG